MPKHLRSSIWEWLCFQKQHLIFCCAKQILTRTLIFSTKNKEAMWKASRQFNEPQEVYFSFYVQIGHWFSTAVSHSRFWHLLIWVWSFCHVFSCLTHMRLEQMPLHQGFEFAPWELHCFSSRLTWRNRQKSWCCLSFSCWIHWSLNIFLFLWYSRHNAWFWSLQEERKFSSLQRPTGPCVWCCVSDTARSHPGSVPLDRCHFRTHQILNSCIMHLQIFTNLLHHRAGFTANQAQM